MVSSQSNRRPSFSFVPVLPSNRLPSNHLPFDHLPFDHLPFNLPTLPAILKFCNPAILLIVLSGCVVERQPNRLEGQARDEWTRSYTLDKGGEVQITNRGPIEVEGVDGDSVEVRVERIVHAANNEAAAEIVPRIEIREEVTPAKVLVRTDGLAGMVIGVTFETSYRVRVPKSATVRLRGSHVSVKGISGRVIVNGTNGAVTGEELSGGVEARSVNGDTTIAMTAVGGDLMDIRAVNGSVTLTLPAKVNANLTASVVEGQIDTGGVKLEPLGEQTQRRVRGKINAGGIPIDLAATRGNVVVKSQ